MNIYVSIKEIMSEGKWVVAKINLWQKSGKFWVGMKTWKKKFGFQKLKTPLKIRKFDKSDIQILDIGISHVLERDIRERY